MVLMKGKVSDIPQDAIVLDRNEALHYQLKLINDWKYPSEVFAFKYATGFLAAASSIVGFYLNTYYRRKFKLISYGRVSSYLPIVFVPAAMSALLHREFVLSDVLLQSNCPVCTELRASAIQATVGFALPMILAPLSALPLATQYGTYNVPFLTKEPLKVLKLWKVKTNPIGNILFAIFLGQALLGSVVTYFEFQSVKMMNTKLAKFEYDLEHGIATQL